MAGTPSITDEVLGQVTQTDPATEPVTGTHENLALDGAMSIHVSKKAGVRWRGILEAALKAYDPERRLWDKAFEQYRKVQDAEPGAERNNIEYRFISDNRTDENLIRETVKLMLRNTYTRNPQIEFSTEVEERKPMAHCLQKSVNAIMQRTNYPGVNAKAIIRRQIVHAHLTNFGVTKLDFKPKNGSRQEALATLLDLQQQLAKETDRKQIDELYAQLETLEEELPLRANKGMCLTNPLPHLVIVDPKCTRYDLTDADWVMEELPLDKAFIRSRYMKKNEDGVWVRLSDGKGKADQPTQEEDAKKVEDSVASTVLGFASEERRKYLDEGTTRCYLIWDRLTQQLSLYSDEDWSYPLWVWGDDLGISQFFPFFIVGFTEPVDGIVQAGETSFYAGQAAEVNMINRKVSQLRQSIFGAIIYNANETEKPTIERLVRHLRNPKEVEAFGIKFDPDKKLEDIVKVFAPPSYEYKELFDKTNLYSTINRTASVTDAMRGSQFKVNTNTTAVNTYNNAAQANTTELTDLVEDSTGRLAWAIAEILVSKYSKDDISELIGATNAADFTPMQVAEFNSTFSMEVVAGSSEKPSSAEKKKEALEIAQALGQIGQAAPMTTMSLVVRMFDEAFSNFLVEDDDWKQLKAEIQNNMTKGVSTPGGAPPAGAAPPPAKPPMPARGPQNAA